MSYSGLPFQLPQMTGAQPQQPPQSSIFGSPFGGGYPIGPSAGMPGQGGTTMGITPPGGPQSGVMGVNPQQPSPLSAMQGAGANIGMGINPNNPGGALMSPIVHALMMQRMGIGPNTGGGNNVMGVHPGAGPTTGSPSNPIMQGSPQNGSSPFGSILQRLSGQGLNQIP